MFYGAEWADVSALTAAYPGIASPRDAYSALQSCWSKETCAPRYREEWSESNPTLGQCSITAFLIQDIFGGRVYGVPLPGGGVHCYNVVGTCVFDTTSEQFGNTVLSYENNPEQCRAEHFSSAEKHARYELLRTRLQAVCAKNPSQK